MSDRKTIQINPEFLKMGGKTRRQTKKNRADGETPIPKIKIRASDTNKEVSSKTLKRRAVISMLQKNMERHKKLLDEGEEPTVNTTTYAEHFNSDFKDAKAFLEQMVEQEKQQKAQHSSTLKHREPPVVPNSLLFHRSVLEPALTDLTVPTSTEPVIHLGEPSISHPMSPHSAPKLPMPTYGCLKGGNLPTFRTLKSREPTPPTVHAINEPSAKPANDKLPTYQKSLTRAQQHAELKQFLEKKKEETQKVERVKKQRNLLIPKHKKQRRTIRRTYRVGKSKVYPKVGVLVSNRTIRNQVMQKKQEIRETPIEDVRKYLMKQGFIRVGSVCPNDVLRKMYESVMLIGGDIKNHNPDNLVYNYLQGHL